MFKNSRSSRKRKDQRTGAAVVEFAMVAPLMILLTMGMIEIGRVVMVKQILVSASREGARLASLPTTTTSQVQDLVTQDLEAQSISGVTVSTNPSDISSAAAGTSITVSVNVSASSVSWIPNPAFTLTNTLEASTTMRRESQ